MGVLAKDEILKLIKKGEIKIKPFKKEQVGPASIDLHLGKKFRIFKRAKGTLSIRNGMEYQKVTHMVEIKGKASFLILPDELIHGITVEKVSLPPYLCGWVHGRSSLERTGLHISSGFIHPGSSNKIVVEISNISQIPLALTPGIKICQLILEEVKGRAIYKGKFRFQKEP